MLHQKLQSYRYFIITGQSTGASIFGSSPLATQPAVVDPSPIMNTGSVFGPSPTNFSSPITTSNLVAQENNGFESTAFATAWGSEAVHQSQPFKPQMQVQAPAAAAVSANENRGFSPSWTPNWGPSAGTVANNTNITISSVASNNSSASKAPINPFTGEFKGFIFIYLFIYEVYPQLPDKRVLVY